MADSSFEVGKEKASRTAQPLLPYEVITIFDPTARAANDLGGEGGLSTAGDYLRFGQMLLGGGQIEGKRVLSRSTVALTPTDHLGTRPGELLLGVHSGERSGPRSSKSTFAARSSPPLPIT